MDPGHPWRKGCDPGHPPYWNNQGTNLGNVGRSSSMQQSSSNSIRPPGPWPPRPPKPQGGRVSLGRGQNKSSNSSGQKRGRGLLVQRHDGKGVLGPGGSSIKRVNTPVLPPKKRAKFKSPQIDSNSTLGNGSDDSNSSDPPAKSPLDPQEDTPNPPPVSSSTEIGLGFHVTAAVSDPPLKISDVDVSVTQKTDQGDVLGLGGYIKKKRFLSKISLADVGEEVKARKKTRLGWGQGLAKYEKRLREKNPHELVADGDNVEPGSSSTIKDDEVVVYTSNVPASSDGSSPPPGNNVDLHDNSTGMTEMMVTQGVAPPASSQGCSPSTGDIGYRGNRSTSLNEIVIHPADEVPDFSRKHSPPPGVGDNSNPCNSSSSMTETVVCTATDLASSHGRSLPSGDADDHGNISTSLTETVIFPVEVPALSGKAVGGSYDPRDSSSSIVTETELASSQGLDPPPAAGDRSGLGKRSTSLTENVISRAVPAFSHIYTTPLPAVAGNSHLYNSSMSMNEEAMACPASSHGYSLPSGDNNGDHGNNSPSLTETVAHRADVPPPSCEYSPPPGDNSAHGNSSTISLTTATVVKSENVLACSDECNLPPDGSNAKSAKVQDIPHILISQQSNKIQKQARMPDIILKKLQKPRTIKSPKKNILFEEPQSYELKGSTLDKAWSQEEKDIFSEKITAFNMDFKKISSFLRHKTMADCIEYYSKHYKSECSEKAKKYLHTMKQSQEEHTNDNGDAPFMSGIATATATKSYTRMKTVAEDIIKKPVDDQICHESMAHLQSHILPDKGHHGESSMDETEVVTGNVLIGEMHDPSPLGKSSPITNSGQAVRLDELKNLNEDNSPNEEIVTEGQEIWTDKERCRLIQATENHGKDFTCMSVYDGTKSVEQCKDHLIKCKTDFNLDKSVSNIDSAICISQSNSKVEETQSVMNADHGDGEIYLVGGSSARGSPERMSLEKLTESCGHKLANGAIIEDKHISSSEENPELCDESKECNDAAQETNSNINNVDSKAPSDKENPRSDKPPCIATNGAELSDHHQHVQPLEDYSHVKVKDIDLNVPLNVDPEDVTSVALDLTEPREKADAAEAMEHESGIRARATSDLGADGEVANDVTHVQSTTITERATSDLGADGEAANDVTHVQSTTITETTRQPANQPGRIMLFGKVIYQGPSTSRTHLTSNQRRNQIVAQSGDMPSNTVVPVTARCGQEYLSGPSNWRSAPVIDPSQQTVLLNNSIPHRSSNNGFAAWPPHQTGSGALVNMNQQQRQDVNIRMPYGTVMRGGTPYHVMPGSSGDGGGLINFNDYNPGQQQMPSNILGTGRMIIGCPAYLPNSIPNQTPIHVPTTIQGSAQHQAIRNEAPRPIVPATIHGSAQQQAIRIQAPTRPIVPATIQGSALQQAIQNQARRAIELATIQGYAQQQAIRNQDPRAIVPITIQGSAQQQAIRNEAPRAIVPSTTQGYAQQEALRYQAPRAIIVPVTAQDSAQKQEELREFVMRWFAS